MDQLLPTDTEVLEGKTAPERRRIQFSMPSVIPTQLDPRQVEMIRRRRPTPATLFRLTDAASPEDDGTPPQWVLGENGALKANLANTPVYQPPSLKAVQKMAQAMGSCGSVEKEDVSSGDEDEGVVDERLQRATVTAEECRAVKPQCTLLPGPSVTTSSFHQEEAIDEGNGECQNAVAN